MTRKSQGQLIARSLVNLKDLEKSLEIQVSKAKARGERMMKQRAWNRLSSTYSHWLKLMRSVSRLATGGAYLDDVAESRAIRRFNRSAKRVKKLGLDASAIPGHVKRNAKLARGHG